MSDLLQAIKYNLLYILMFIVLIASAVYHYINQEVSEDKPKKPVKFYIGVVAGVCFIIALLIYLIKNSKEFQKDAQENPVVQKSPVAQISKSDYQKQTDENTKREIEKLMKSEKYRQHLAKKGNDETKYNWQLAEKEKKVVYRDDVSDEEGSVDSLSKVE
jgi:hypothetical protein